MRWIEPRRPGELILPDRRLLRPRPLFPCYDRAPIPIHAAIDAPQGVKAEVGSGTSATTGSMTTTAAGSTFVIGIGLNAGRTYTVSDSKSNTYTAFAAELTWNTGGSAIRWYHCINGTGGASHTASCNVSAGGATGITLYLVEITGGLTVGILDAAASQVEDTASPYTSSNHTTTNADDLLLSFFIGDSGSNPATHTPGNSFTTVSGCDTTDGTQFYTGCMMKRVVAATGTYNSSLTETGSGRGAITIASFKAAAGGATVYNRTSMSSPIFNSRVIQ